MRRILCFLAVLSLTWSLPFRAQNAAPDPPPAATDTAADEAAIRGVMDKSAADWNKGDLDAFATSYKNSPGILFVGTHVSRGYDGMLASYRKGYPTAASRGTLTYSNLEVHLLDARYAAVLGNCHLERTVAGGGNFDCIFSLVFEKTPDGWKIILDHSSAVSPAKPVVAHERTPGSPQGASGNERSNKE